MKVTPLKTEIIRANSMSMEDILSRSFCCVPENSIIAISSKIISLCEGRVVKPGNCIRDEIIEAEADLFLPKGDNKYNVYLTVKNHILIPNAGVDESNSDGYYVLWPKDPQASAQRCWEFIRKYFHVANVGVIIADSTDTPLKWGVTGVSIAHCGFASVNSKIGSTDLFGRRMSMTKINVANGLAAAAVLCILLFVFSDGRRTGIGQ
jgi:F420-0:gamma-glutamyl ligase